MEAFALPYSLMWSVTVYEIKPVMLFGELPVPEVGVKEGRVEAVAAEQCWVDAVDGGAQDAGHGAVHDAPERD